MSTRYASVDAQNAASGFSVALDAISLITRCSSGRVEIVDMERDPQGWYSLTPESAVNGFSVALEAMSNNGLWAYPIGNDILEICASVLTTGSRTRMEGGFFQWINTDSSLYCSPGIEMNSIPMRENQGIFMQMDLIRDQREGQSPAGHFSHPT